MLNLHEVGIEDYFENHDEQSDEELTYFETLKKKVPSLRNFQEVTDLGPWEQEHQAILAKQTKTIQFKPKSTRTNSNSQKILASLNSAHFSEKTLKSASTPPNSDIKSGQQSENMMGNSPEEAPILKSTTIVNRASDSKVQEILGSKEKGVRKTRNISSHIAERRNKAIFSDYGLVRPRIEQDLTKFTDTSIKIEPLETSSGLSRPFSQKQLGMTDRTQTLENLQGKLTNLNKLFDNEKTASSQEETVSMTITNFNNYIATRNQFSRASSVKKLSFRSRTLAKLPPASDRESYSSQVSPLNSNEVLVGNRLYLKKIEQQSITPRVYVDNNHDEAQSSTLLPKITDANAERPIGLSIQRSHGSLGSKSGTGSRLKRSTTTSTIGIQTEPSPVNLLSDQPAFTHLRLATPASLRKVEHHSNIASSDFEAQGQQRQTFLNETASSAYDREGLKETLKILKKIKQNARNKKSVSIETHGSHQPLFKIKIRNPETHGSDVASTKYTPKALTAREKQELSPLAKRGK